MIPYGRQDVNHDDIQAVVDVLQSDWLTTGPAVDRLEQRLQEVTGGTPVLAVTSGTAALHVAYAAAGIGPGDEIITPPITFIATQATAVALGATVVFADVSLDTANIDPEAVEAAIGPRTKAIVAVDYAGHPADLDALSRIAQKHGLLLIEDAAHSLGSTYKGRQVGSVADITTFSFYPTKNITTAEGGAVAVRDSARFERARLFARQGIIRDPARLVAKDEGPWHQEVHQFGLNYRLPDILAVLGESQIRRLQEFKARRQRIKSTYDQCLQDQAEFVLPTQRDDVDPVWHLYPLRVPAAKRRRLFESLRETGIGVQVNYLPAYWHPVFRDLGYSRGLCPNAEEFYLREISLPIYSGLSDREQEYVVSSLLNAIEE